ncbi:GFA family protein [Paragemmobacter straminiformis]|uniref:GFA family protein n=1 Tax=Paragemmobacter straminiformis TaxID=2045119 RepID=A0A842I4Z8_9RHOB|nr:GFA family protein [Gemmobacter straminiformis]MBC2834910.1 GFA family protein [Gemmobacter straminiformis]
MRGSCLCGAVVFEADTPLRPVIACHCTQCRKTSGHFWAATSVPTAALRMVRDDGLAWFRSSDSARRGFCRTCGSSLFWEPVGGDTTSIGAGTIDGETGVSVECHWYVADKGDYYELNDGLPQFDRES